MIKLIVYIVATAIMLPLARIQRWAGTAVEPMTDEELLDRHLASARRRDEAYHRAHG